MDLQASKEGGNPLVLAQEWVPSGSAHPIAAGPEQSTGQSQGTQPAPPQGAP
jgi:hypothetical protein